MTWAAQSRSFFVHRSKVTAGGGTGGKGQHACSGQDEEKRNGGSCEYLFPCRRQSKEPCRHHTAHISILSSTEDT